MSSTEHERVGDRGVSTAGGAEPWLGGLTASLEPGPHRRVDARRSLWAYRRVALIHPSNVIMLAGILMLSLVHPSLEIVLLGLGAEGLFFCLAPRSPWFRRCLDEGLEEAARSAAQRARELLIAKLADGHRDEIARLDNLIKRIQESEAARAEPVSFAEELDLLRSFTASYLRLALAHKACEDALSACEQKPSRVSIRSLEAAEGGAPPRVREAIRERLAIAYQRAAHEARLREDIEVIAHQLATLVDLIHLRHQKAITLGPSAEAHRSMQALEETRSVERELSELDAKDRLPMKSIACA
jgi:hypothetical protein